MRGCTSSATLERGTKVCVFCSVAQRQPGSAESSRVPPNRFPPDPDVYRIVSYGATARGATGEMCPGAILKTFFYDTRDSERIRHTEQDHARAPSVQAHLPTQEPSCSFHNWICGPRFCQDHVHATIATGTWPPVPSSRSTGTQPVPSSGARRHTEAP